MTRSLLAAVAASLALAAPASAQNPWLAERVKNFAHQGGDAELPGATMYAFERSLRVADWLEIDVNLTKDEQLAVIHDTTLDRTTNGTGPVADRTLAEIQQLDAAYWHVPDVGARRVAERRPTDTYSFRGVRTGAVPPPSGFEPGDFMVPSLEEVLRAFPGIVVNIEIKGETEAIQMRTAEVLAGVLDDSGRPDRFIVVSFRQSAVDRFHELAPAIPVAPGVEGGARFLLQNQSPGDGVVALQIPITFRFGDQLLTVATPENVMRAHEAGYAVHVWLSNDTEDVATYRRLLRMCVDAIMAARPFLLARELARLRGEDPCGTRVVNRRPNARGRRVRLLLRRTGRSEERRSGLVRLHAIRRDGRAGRVLGRDRWGLPSGRERLTSVVRLNRRGRAAVRRRGRTRMLAAVQERGNVVSSRIVRIR